MSTNWIIPDVSSVEALLTAIVLKTADQPLTYSKSEMTRIDKTLDMEVVRIRAAIQLAGISSLSLTIDAIPPEGEKHCAAFALQSLISSIPQYANYVISAPGGGKTGLEQIITQAQKWFDDISKGSPVVPPTDPCGQDYLTAVDPINNPAVEAIKWGDSNASSDEYAAGQKSNPDGSITPVYPIDVNLHI